MAKKTVQTNEGEVSYETVICSSCGDEIMKDGARLVIVGEGGSTNHRPYIDKYKYSFYGRKPDTGWLCDICHEEPSAYPHVNDKKSDKGRLWHLKKVITG